MQPSGDIQRLIEIMTALRTPGTGCPWDLEQTHATLAPYALEEAYEVVDAIERGSLDDLREELGDLLLQVVFHARLAEETGAFDFADIVEGVTSKMVRRHPHVFGTAQMLSSRAPERDQLAVHGLLAAMNEPAARNADLSTQVWEAMKVDERRAKGQSGKETAKSVLADVPIPLPGLTRAVKLQKKASRVGFDWGDAKLVLAKIREEIEEIERELDGGSDGAIADEIGDLIFAVANLARHAGIDPETAVRGTNAKFERRFAYIEKGLAARNSSPQASTLDEMDALWNEAKRAGL